MVEFDITDYLNADEDCIGTIKSWLYEHVGSLSVSWYVQRSQRAHVFEGEGEGWRIKMHIGKKFRTNTPPFSLVSWILEIEDDLAAMHFKLIWPETAMHTT